MVIVYFVADASEASDSNTASPLAGDGMPEGVFDGVAYADPFTAAPPVDGVSAGGVNAWPGFFG